MKNVDFSKGVRGKHANITFDIIGEIKEVWAICVTQSDENLIPLKLYNIEILKEKIKVRNEKGETINCPKTWFAPLDVSPKIIGLIEKVS